MFSFLHYMVFLYTVLVVGSVAFKLIVRSKKFNKSQIDEE